MNDKPLQLNTGANACIKRETLKPTCGSVRIQTAIRRSTPVYSESSLCIMKIGIGKTAFKHRILVADIVNDFILGMDFMKHYGVVVDIKEEVLRIGKEEVPLHLPDASSTILQLILIEEEKIPPLTERILKARITGNFTGYHMGVTEPPKTKHLKKGLLLAKTLVKIRKTIPVRVVNVNSHPVFLSKGSDVGHCGPVEWIENSKGNKSIENWHGTRNRVPETFRKTIQHGAQHLISKETAKLQKVMLENAKLFITSEKGYGRTNIVHHRINTGDSTAIHQAPRLPLAKPEEANKLLE